MSIQPNELRLGNLCMESTTGNILKVVSIRPGLYGVIFHGEMPDGWDYEGIPITPEWLERLGFKLDHTKQSWHHRVFVNGDGSFQIEEYNDEYRFGVNDGEYYIGPKMLHVHQLQNLFFALTGQELTVKEKV
jgi:hypothetical protein